MHILLVQPYFKRIEKMYPLGLAHIGSVLKQRKHEVFGADLNYSSLADTYSLIDEKGIDLIGVFLTSYNLRGVFSFCRKIKKDKNIPIAAAGPYSVAFREKLLYNYGDCFDYLITGENEYSFLDLADTLGKGLKPNFLEGLIYLEGKNVIINKKRGNKENNFFALSVPDRNLFPVFKYKGMLARNKDYTQIITSRGCNRNCDYCSVPKLNGKWRGRPPEKVVGEIKSLVDDYGIREFHFEDSNFFGGGIERIKLLCRLIIESKLNIIWQCPNGIPVADFDDESVLELMAQAGCYSICLGVESFDNNTLKASGRFTDFKRVKSIIETAHRVGIEVVGYFMIGFPGQNSKSIKNDIILSRKLNFDFMHYSIFYLVPGSKLYEDYFKKSEFGKIVDRKVYVSTLNIKHLKLICFLTFLRNCFIPRFFSFGLRNLKAIRNPFDFMRRMAIYFLDTEFKF